MGYRFLDLTEEQKHERRELLDWYGFFAQVSALAPIAALQCYYMATWLSHRLQNQNDLEAPSSPYAKEARTGGKGTVARLRRSYSNFLWWCGDSVDVYGYHFGAKGDVLGAALWAAWLVFLCFPQTGEGRSTQPFTSRIPRSLIPPSDYMHLAKRFGAVGASQLPLQYLLALKSPYSPLQLLTRSSHETLNVLHQHLGYVINALFYAHVGMYVNFFLAKNLLAEKLLAGYIIAGVFSIISFTTVGTTALQPLRRWSYRVFYTVHVTLAAILLPALWFHVSHIRLYIYETAAVYAINALLRWINTSTYPGTIRLIPETGLLEVTVQPPKASLGKWQPGQHAYLSLAGHPLLRTFKSNPFTVASLPSADDGLKFVAKVLDGNTARLAQSTKGTVSSQQLSIEGPYGVASHGDELLRYGRVLFVAGGVGATFVLPLYRQLLADLSPGKGSYRRQKVEFIWAVRSRPEMTWALPSDVKEREEFVERLSVFLTGTTSSASALRDDSDAAGDMKGDAIELQEQQELLSSEVKDDAATDSSNEISIRTGRPDLRKVVAQVFAHSMSEKVAVVVCGPVTLNQALRKEVAMHVRKGRDVWFWEERFAF